MEIIKGIPVSTGVVIGEVFVLDSEDYRIPHYINKNIQNVGSEKERYLEAIKNGINELKEIEKETRHMSDIFLIFQGHRYVLEDPETQQEILKKIETDYCNAEYAVSQVMWKHRQKLASLPAKYYARRLSDLEDIENRLLRHLLGAQRENLQNLKKSVIIIAKDLTPSQTAMLPTDLVLGMATDMGGRTSHTAIVARTRGVPAVVGLGNGTSELCGGDIAIIDGNKGLLIIRPDEKTKQKYQSIQKKVLVHHKKLKKLKNLPAETLDGYDITLRSNIEHPSEVKIALENGSMGIGLYRTEFIYVTHPNPSEETHFKAYKEALEHLKDHKLTIRTFDFGADKDFGIENAEKEPNPFLGCRSIRLCFEHLSVFKAQLRAILRASVYGDVDIMFPMISSLEELLQAKEILKEAKKELDHKKIPYNRELKVGIMIEIPAAVIISDILAQEVDFFSIGTNDLIQYTLAVDRSNSKIAHLYKPAHPAVFRLISQVINAGKKHNIKVSMCGEMSGEALYVIPLLGIGLREFSLSPGLIPSIKDFIRSLTLREATKIAKELMSCRTHEEATKYLATKSPKHLQI